METRRKTVEFQGLPPICWSDGGAAKRPRYEWSVPAVSAPTYRRDHLDCGSVASPKLETEAMKDGSAIATGLS